MLLDRLKEAAPGRIQLLTGPRQVGKTTLMEGGVQWKSLHSIGYSPRRHIRPTLQLAGRPCIRLVRVARGAGIRHLVLVGHRRSDESERVGAHERTWHTLALNLRHVAGNALTPRAAHLVVRVLL